MVKCPECNLDYVPEIPDNVDYHQKYHDEMVNGLPVKVTESDQIVWQENENCISVINSLSSPTQKKLAEKVGIIANRDTEYDFPPYSAAEEIDECNVHVFLYHVNDRIVGFLLAEKQTHIWNCTWQQYDQKIQPIEVSNIPFLWSVGLVWVNRQHRQKGIAKKLIKKAAQFFEIEINNFGWYAPPITESGEAMLRHLLPESFYIAK